MSGLGTIYPSIWESVFFLRKMLIFTLMLLMKDFGLFSSHLGFGNSMEKTKSNIAKRIKALIILVLITLVLTAVGLFSFYNFKHYPFLLHQTEVQFTDSNNGVYFCLTGNDLIKKYDDNADNYYTNVLLTDEDKSANVVQLAADSDFIYAALELAGSITKGMIKKYDKSFNEIRTVHFGDNVSIRGIACNNESVYCCVYALETNKFSLFKYDKELTNRIVLSDSLNDSEAFKDDETYLFFSDTHSIQIERSKTVLVERHNLPGYQNCLTNGKVHLFLTDKSINVKENNNQTSFNNKMLFNALYSKAVINNGHLIFATYKNEKNPKCGSFRNLKGGCICGMKESYLFDYNLITKTISLTKKFKSGTFLIDYDVDDVKYYFNGNLFINDAPIKTCKRVDTKIEKWVNLFDDSLQPLINYYPSFYDGAFYGIM